MHDQQAPVTSDVIEVMAYGDLEVEGRIIEASNATLLAMAHLNGSQVRCVYKPVRGERPLWDFPSRTLGRRELATYLIAQAAPFDVVPATTWRGDGPYGAGMVQAWVQPSDDEQAGPGAGLVDVVAPEAVPTGWYDVLRAEDARGDDVALVHADSPALRKMAALDIVCNNADRKGGHVLRGRTPADIVDCTYGVDHGLTFHVEEKLRTVLWGFAGSRLDADIRAGLESLVAGLTGSLGADLAELLAPNELEQTRLRTTGLLRSGRFPRVGPRWPALPWPAF